MQNIFFFYLKQLFSLQEMLIYISVLNKEYFENGKETVTMILLHRGIFFSCLLSNISSINLIKLLKKQYLSLRKTDNTLTKITKTTKQINKGLRKHKKEVTPTPLRTWSDSSMTHSKKVYFNMYVYVFLYSIVSTQAFSE